MKESGDRNQETGIKPLCDFWLRSERGSERCGQPATHYRRTAAKVDFFYCEAHARQATEQTNGKTLPRPISEMFVNHGDTEARR